MANVIIESKHFDINVVEAFDSYGLPRYIVRYGLQVEKEPTMEKALVNFKNCLHHAMECEGMEIF